MKTAIALQEVVNGSILNFPTLYRVQGDPRLSRLKALNHLLLTNGNGLDWTKHGDLRSGCGENYLAKSLPDRFFEAELQELTLSKSRVESAGKLAKALGDKIFHKHKDRRFGEVNFLIEIGAKEARDIIADIFELKLRPDVIKCYSLYEDGIHLHPADARQPDYDNGGLLPGKFKPSEMCKYSAMSEVLEGKSHELAPPLKVEPAPDWLAACVELAREALAFYRDPQRAKGSFYHPDQCLRQVEYDYNRAKDSKGGLAQFRKDHGWRENDTPRTMLTRAWKALSKEQIEFFERFLAKFDK